MSLQLDDRQIDMLAQMRVWLPATRGAGQGQRRPLAQPGAAFATTTSHLAQGSRHTAQTVEQGGEQGPVPMSLPVRQGAPSRLDLAVPVYFQISNISTELLTALHERTAVPYRLVVVGEMLEGQAMELLANMLATLGLLPGQIFIAHLQSARMVHSAETPFHSLASAQVMALRAPCVLALGPHAAKAMLQEHAGQSSAFADQPFSRLREAPMLLKNPAAAASASAATVSLTVSFHPLQLLRTPGAKARAWEDLKRVHQLLRAIRDR